MVSLWLNSVGLNAMLFKVKMNSSILLPPDVKMNEACNGPASAYTFIKKKTERQLDGGKLRVLDLFSGCGGLSLGFHGAGYDIVASVELDEEASRSHAMNFHKGHNLFEEFARSRNIQETTPSALFDDIGISGECGDQVDIIIGGPPCQAFTRVGRAKLRAVFKDTDAFLNDPRSQLYKRYLQYVKELSPLAILMENVPDMLNYGGVNIAELVCNDLVEYGYKCKYTLLNTVYYGVPQMRERMFLIAVHESINAEILFPSPTHYVELPKGYLGSRNVALKNINPGEENQHYVNPPLSDIQLTPAITAMEALSDLPVIKDHLKNKLKRGGKKLTEVLKYRTPEAENDYQRLMRNRHDGKTETHVSANAIRILPRDYPIFRKMKPGDQYPQAIKVANKLLEAKLRKEKKVFGKIVLPGTKRYKQLVKETIPPYDVSKFPNKWRKMEADKPSRTLMAHLGKDSYSHIHYDSAQARTISVREAARLQSFPDGFEFSGAMNAAFRQIGNAVPPLMATKLAESIKQTIETGIRCHPEMNLQT
jgi:DNA (cytosine-5)-methyltransferase 1